MKHIIVVTAFALGAVFQAQAAPLDFLKIKRTPESAASTVALAQAPSIAAPANATVQAPLIQTTTLPTPESATAATVNWSDFFGLARSNFDSFMTGVWESYNKAKPAFRDYENFVAKTSSELAQIAGRNPQFTGAAVVCIAGVCLSQWYLGSHESQRVYNELQLYIDEPNKQIEKFDVSKREELKQRLIDAANFSWRVRFLPGYGYTGLNKNILNMLINSKDIKRIDAFVDAVQALKVKTLTNTVNANDALVLAVKKLAADVQLILIRNSQLSLTPKA